MRSSEPRPRARAFKALGPALAMAWAAAFPVFAADAPELSGLIREALEKNASLRSARLDADAAFASAKGSQAWDAPKVGVEFFETPLSSFPNPLRNQKEIDYFLEQNFPFPGKRGARAEAERLRGKSAAGRAKAMEDALIRDVKSAYYGLGLIDARLRGNGDNQALARRLIESARKQYEVGLGRQADILRAQTELSALESEALSLREARIAAVGELNILLDRPADRAFDATDSIEPEPVKWSYGRLKALAEERHPVLKALDMERAMRGAEADAARREFFPDLMVKGAYKSMEGPAEGMHASTPEDTWSLMLAVEVPVTPWSSGKYNAGYRIAKVNMEKAERDRRQAANRVDADLRAALARADAAWRQWKLAGDALVPQSEQALNSSLSAYQTGKGGFMGLLDAYRAALAARLEKDMAAAKSLQSRAELERAVGMDLDSIPAEPGTGGES
jgi:outer membrane protein TolC